MSAIGNEVLQEIYATQSVKSGNGELIDIRPTSILYEEGVAMYDLILQNKSTRTMEIGLAYGLSTLFICQAHEDVGGTGIHTAFDPLEHTLWQSVGLLNIERAGLIHRLSFDEGYSHEVLPRLLEQNHQYDFVFVDGAHLFDHVMLDFYYVNLLTRSGGYVMIHDLWMPAVRKLLCFVLRNMDYELMDRPAKFRKPWWRVVTRNARAILQSPLDLHSWSLPFLLGKPHLLTSNFCILRKAGTSDRSWDHYRSF